MTTKTITWVSDVSDKPDDHGNLYVNVSFDDDTVGYKGSKPDTIGEHHAALAALVDKPSEFMLEDTGKKSAKGKDKFKIVGYPGWTAQSYSGGGGGGAKSWYNSEEGVRFTQDQTNRRTALMQARKLVMDSGVQESDRTVLERIQEATQALYRLLEMDLDVAPPTRQQAENPGPTDPGGATSSDVDTNEGTSETSGTEGRVDPGEGGSPSSARHDQLWANLVSFAEGKVKALKLVNQSTNSSYGKPGDIPEDVLESVIRTYAIGEMQP